MTESDGSALDDHQYTVAGLAAYEGIYGRDFVSPGGRRTTAEILNLLDWQPGLSALDVGCGLGGAMFMMATDFDATVFGIDMSRHMADAAAERCVAYGLADQVTVVHGDILTVGLPRRFDIVHSREVFLHIHDKVSLFRTLHEALAPDGRLLFSDYCCGPDQPSAAFTEYVDEFGYDLRPIDEIAALLADAGFRDVVATDQTDEFIAIHKRELDELADSGLNDEDRQELQVGWLAKIDRAERGEQRWGLFRATTAGE